MSLVLSGSDGITFPDTTEQDTGYANGIGFRNRIINGDMRIAQRGTSALTVNAPSFFYPVDRFFGAGTASAGVYTVQQSSVAPTGFNNSIVATVTTASTPSADQGYTLLQHLEGFNIADFGFGTANAQAITLSFWVRSSVTGTFGGSVRNTLADRSYVFSYTISDANTWEQKTVTIPGDTSGTWDNTNGLGMRLSFSLGRGSAGLGTPGSWTSNNFSGATGQTNLIQTNGATFYITGVQLEAGSVATPFERRPYGTELMLCQRYYYFHTSFAETNFGLVGIGYNYTSSQMNAVVYFPTTMRIAPTLVATSGTNYYLFERNGADDFCNSLTINGATPKTTMLSNTTEISGTAGQAGRLLTYTSGASVAFNAEL